MPSNHQLNRISVDLPESLVEDVKNLAAANETTLAELWFHWVTTAARLAHRGYGHLLPQEKRAKRGTLGDPHMARWAQSKASFERSRQAIEAEGSSVPAVLREAGASYVAANGDHLEMDWPRLRRSSRQKSAAAEAA